MRPLSSTSLSWYRARHPRAWPRRTGCIHTTLAAALGRQPGRTLLMDEARHLTNGQVLEGVARRARLLLSRCGAPGATVAVYLDNDVELALSYFACLQAGLRYLPLPKGSAADTATLLTELRPRVLVTSRRCDPGADATHTLYVDELDASAPLREMPLPPPDPHRPAHVLLTSGTSTGMPRAVLTDHVGSMLSHRWRIRLWPFDPRRDVVGCNIFGVWDLVPALLHGVPAVMLDDATVRDPAALADAVVRYGITRMMITPTLLDACLAAPEAVAALRRLRQIVLCGEAVTAPLMESAQEHLPEVRVANLYSASECHDIAAGILQPGADIHSGRVADFAEVHVVEPDDPQTLVKVGRPGRILVGGAGLAHGYLDDAETARRFLSIGLDPGAVTRRVYDTGDVGTLDADGVLRVLGRLETRVKVRGAWANPDDLGRALRRHRWVSRAAVSAGTGARGHTRLMAWVVPARGAPPDLARRLRAELAHELAPRNVPAAIEVTNDLPLLASGKIDAARLGGEHATRRPEGLPASDAGTSTAALADQVLRAFRTILESPDAGPEDRFDDLGGDSLAAIVLCGRLQSVTNRPVRVQDVHEYPTPAALTAFLARRHRQPSAPPAPASMMPLPQAAPRPRAPAGTGVVLVTGGTGTVGSALLTRLLEGSDHLAALIRARNDAEARSRLAAALPANVPTGRLSAVAGDLTRPWLGLSAAAFERLASRVRSVVHLAARVDAFAHYGALAGTNVTGTRTLLELALMSGATFHHLSSSAVFPLEPDTRWNETACGRSLLERLTPQLEQSDGYSRTKHAAEILVWEAAERGLEVTVTRIPHLVGGRRESRLADTLDVLIALSHLPEGDWRWQLAPVDAVCERLLDRVRGRDAEPLAHVTAPPVPAERIEAALRGRGQRLQRLSAPALSNAVGAAARGDGTRPRDRQRRNLAALHQLVLEHGPRAALCLSEPVLDSARPLQIDPLPLLLDSRAG